MPLDLKKMASDAQQLSFAQLMISRGKNGFQHFFTDLKGYNSDNLAQKFTNLSEVKPRDGRKWQLTGKEDGPGSTLVIEPGAEQKDFEEIHALLDKVLGEKNWYEKSTLDEDKIFTPPNTHPDFPPNFPKVKTLGKVGENPAVDPIFVIVGEDGKLKVLAGARPTGEKAFPGGMNEDTVKETCLNELLEEVFGGSLFDGKSGNSKKADELFAADQPDYNKKIDTFIKSFGDEFKKISPDNISSISERLKGDGSSLDKINNIKKLNFYTSMNESEQNHLLIRLKCKLYEHLLPEEFNKFKKFVDESLTSGEKVVNQSDPRNTAISWMVTTPLVGLVTNENFERIRKECGLDLIAGDDLVGPKFMDLEEIVNNGYSDHPTLALNAVATLVKENKLVISPEIEERLNGINYQINLKMEEINKLGKSSAKDIFLSRKNFEEEPVKKEKDKLNASHTVNEKDLKGMILMECGKYLDSNTPEILKKLRSIQNVIDDLETKTYSSDLDKSETRKSNFKVRLEKMAEIGFLIHNNPSVENEDRDLVLEQLDLMIKVMGGDSYTPEDKSRQSISCFKEMIELSKKLKLSTDESVIVSANNGDKQPETHLVWNNTLHGASNTNNFTSVKLADIERFSKAIERNTDYITEVTQVRDIVETLVKNSKDEKSCVMQHSLSNNDIRQVCEPNLSKQESDNQAEVYAQYLRKFLDKGKVYLTYENAADPEAIKAHALQTAKFLKYSPEVAFEIIVRDNHALTKDIMELISKAPGVQVSASANKF